MYLILSDSNPKSYAFADECCRKYGLHFLAEGQTDTLERDTVYIELSDPHGIRLCRTSQPPLQFKIDFLNDHLQYLRKTVSFKKEKLVKACGPGSSVLDLTCGLGIDSIFLARAGYQVTGIERNPALYLMLDQALKNAVSSEWDHFKKINFCFEEAGNYLRSTQNEYDIIYYDPMYPHADSSALPGKNMQILRSLIGSNDSDIDLLKLAITKAKTRVVVKRPLRAPPLIEPVKHQIQGKLVRFDIY